jgi:hypothetical protein
MNLNISLPIKQKVENMQAKNGTENEAIGVSPKLFQFLIFGFHCDVEFMNFNKWEVFNDSWKN